MDRSNVYFFQDCQKCDGDISVYTYQFSVALTPVVTELKVTS
jgi:hypothetical protein